MQTLYSNCRSSCANFAFNKSLHTIINLNTKITTIKIIKIISIFNIHNNSNNNSNNNSKIISIKTDLTLKRIIKIIIDMKTITIKSTIDTMIPETNQLLSY
jgi:hypothetical protein